MANHDIATARELRIYVLYMTPNKNGEVIFGTHWEKIDRTQQVPSTEKTISLPWFCSLH